MTTFKIVFYFLMFFLSAENHNALQIDMYFYIRKQAHFSQLFCLQVRSVTP